MIILICKPVQNYENNYGLNDCLTDQKIELKVLENFYEINSDYEIQYDDTHLSTDNRDSLEFANLFKVIVLENIKSHLCETQLSIKKTIIHLKFIFTILKILINHCQDNQGQELLKELLDSGTNINAHNLSNVFQNIVHKICIIESRQCINHNKCEDYDLMNNAYDPIIFGGNSLFEKLIINYRAFIYIFIYSIFEQHFHELNNKTEVILIAVQTMLVQLKNLKITKDNETVINLFVKILEQVQNNNQDILIINPVEQYIELLKLVELFIQQTISKDEFITKINDNFLIYHNFLRLNNITSKTLLKLYNKIVILYSYDIESAMNQYINNIDYIQDFQKFFHSKKNIQTSLKSEQFIHCFIIYIYAYLYYDKQVLNQFFDYMYSLNDFIREVKCLSEQCSILDYTQETINSINNLFSLKSDNFLVNGLQQRLKIYLSRSQNLLQLNIKDVMVPKNDTERFIYFLFFDYFNYHVDIISSFYPVEGPINIEQFINNIQLDNQSDCQSLLIKELFQIIYNKLHRILINIKENELKTISSILTYSILNKINNALLLSLLDQNNISFTFQNLNDLLAQEKNILPMKQLQQFLAINIDQYINENEAFLINLLQMKMEYLNCLDNPIGQQLESFNKFITGILLYSQDFKQLFGKLLFQVMIDTLKLDILQRQNGPLQGRIIQSKNYPAWNNFIQSYSGSLISVFDLLLNEFTDTLDNPLVQQLNEELLLYSKDLNNLFNQY